MKTDPNYFIELENEYGAHNYHSLPVVIKKANGIYMWDVEDKKYFDFLSAYSAVNQGHNHPRITDTLIKQTKKLSLTSRAFYNDQLGLFESYISDFFGYDKVLPMNSGAEAVETAIKICRKWGYEKKKIEDGKAKIIVFDQNFHGRTTTIISFSSDSLSYNNFGPYTPGFYKVEYNNLDALNKVINDDKNIAGILIEPIQGEAGVVVPDNGFLKSIEQLCKKNNILFIADEIQSGLCRTGKLLACNYEEVRPDMIILGKALSGGTYPISCVLADNEVMDVIKPGEHGSTYGGNPVAAAVAIESLKVLKDENLAENAFKLGNIFRTTIEQELTNSKWFKMVRGKGLLNAILVNDKEDSLTAWNICIKLKEKGILAKPTHGNIIRFSPPLIIKESEIKKACEIIIEVFKTF